MFNQNKLNSFIKSKDYSNAFLYLIQEFENLLCEYIPEYASNKDINLIDARPDLTGILTSYSLIQNETTFDSLIENQVIRLMDCFKALQDALQTKN